MTIRRQINGSHGSRSSVVEMVVLDLWQRGAAELADKESDRQSQGRHTAAGFSIFSASAVLRPVMSSVCAVIRRAWK